jgi:hypothetical protein
MENPTPFDLNEAIRRWRAEFGSPCPLNAVELEELESHLRDHAAALQAGGMTPEAAFSAAAKQLGERQRVAAEFAKINPTQIWLERGIWMALGVILMFAFHLLARGPNGIIFTHAMGAGWNPALCVALSRYGGFGIVAVLVALVWFVLARRPGWGRALVASCERSLLATGVAMVLVLWGCERLNYLYDYLLHEYVPWLHAWLFPTIQALSPENVTVINRIALVQGIAENIVWAIALCVLATRVVRVQQSSLLATCGQRITTNSLWLERFMWMVAGYVLVLFGVPFLHGLVLGPALWIVPALGPSAVLQHLVGLITAALGLVLWTTPFWACWLFTTRRPWFGDWIRRAFRCHPFWTSVGVALLLNANVALWLLLLWTGVHAKLEGRGFGPIISEWNFGSWMVICQRVAPVVLLVWLLQRRRKLRAA